MTSFPKFQTKVRVSSGKVIQGIAASVQGPRPTMFQHIMVGDESDATIKPGDSAENQSFLRKYVSFVNIFYFFKSLLLHISVIIVVHRSSYGIVCYVRWRR